MSLLGVFVCGAPLTQRCSDLISAAEHRGWDITLIATDAARHWLPTGLSRESDRRPDAAVVAPLTFNTGNKWAAGISDTRPMGLLNEVIGAGRAAVAVPMVNHHLWGHPAWSHTIATLTEAGVQLLDPRTGRPAAGGLPSGQGDQITAQFRPEWALDALG